MAEVQRRKWADPKERAKRETGLRRAFADPERRQKMSERSRGEKNPFYGKSHTPETRAKMREGHKNAPQASCVLCRKTLTVSRLARHLKACRPS